MKKVNLLALSGSLREVSYNTAALRALMHFAPADVDIRMGNIANLPLFNPDLEGSDIPPLDELNKALKWADGLILASPEYAHGISGPMKNALDWLVGGVEFPDMPIMLVNTSPRAFHAQEALKEVLSTMSGDIVEEACVTIPLLSSGLDETGIVENPELAGVLLSALETFCRSIRSHENNLIVS
ncbi:NADPH-dependent FMN reductase [Saccharospirillum salsuginis]|uniref:NADPH-dependent FMN reductase-like domain-containing protein n=1 Tax=Saccharospirillum salsuginis TaxID=418750 RepID=A0A918ND73_9GAMM|nr:NADPH-dependent FMN reductase [Saccharospirillum salsuginis]GGX63942.1 hypothetical protein GCM10007392_34500 [Saccharospirillum salsuginis]